MTNNEIKILSQVEHVLLRTGRYVGSTKHVSQSMFLFNDDGKIVFQSVNYVPGLCKIIREILDNSCDEHMKTSGKFATKISISCEDRKKIVIEDNGRGIPVKKLENGMWSPEAAWTELRAGSNFTDSADNTSIGQNGEGAALTCMLSKYFEGETCDGSHRFTIICKDNLKSKDIKTRKCSAPGTTVTFVPDYERFELTELDDVHEKILKSDIYNLAMSFPKIEFFYNKKRIKGSGNFHHYMRCFSEVFECYEANELSVGIIPSSSDDYCFLHYVNGVNVCDGGNLMDEVVGNIVGKIRDKLVRKYKTLKPGDIKNKLSFIVFVKGVPNPRFDSQAKTKCINPGNEIREWMNNPDWERFISKALKNDSLISPIVEYYALKEELQHRKNLTNVDKALGDKIRCSKYLAPIKERKYLVLCEGASAKGGLLSAIGRDCFGYYELKGVPMNAYDMKMPKIVNNEELKNIMHILSLKASDHTHKDISFKNVLIATDADLDGQHIQGLLIGFFFRHFPWMVQEGLIKRLRTPIVVLKHKNEVKHFFFDLNEFNTFCSKHDIGKFEVDYKKGLGSWNKDELISITKQKGIDFFIESFSLDDVGSKCINDWLSDSMVDTRKEYLRKNNFNIFSI